MDIKHRKLCMRARYGRTLTVGQTHRTSVEYRYGVQSSYMYSTWHFKRRAATAPRFNQETVEDKFQNILFPPLILKRNIFYENFIQTHVVVFYVRPRVENRVCFCSPRMTRDKVKNRQRRCRISRSTQRIPYKKDTRARMIRITRLISAARVPGRFLFIFPPTLPRGNLPECISF